MRQHERRDVCMLTIRATTQSIYRAFLSEEAILRWLPPKGAHGALDRFEPYEGGRFRLTLTFDSAAGKSSAQTDVVEGRFIRLEADRQVVMAVAFMSDDPAYAGTMTMSWQLEAVPHGTCVTFEAAHVPVGISQEDHEAGMRSSLENLAAWMEGQ